MPAHRDIIEIERMAGGAVDERGVGAGRASGAGQHGGFAGRGAPGGHKPRDDAHHGLLAARDQGGDGVDEAALRDLDCTARQGVKAGRMNKFGEGSGKSWHAGFSSDNERGRVLSGSPEPGGRHSIPSSL
jgi:hypothetical protein